MRTLTTAAVAASVITLFAANAGADWPASKGSLPGRPADEITAPTNQRAALEAQQADLTWRAMQTKGVARLEVLSEQQRLDGMIRDLESGRPVSADAVEPR
jgi:hypothetical protein